MANPKLPPILINKAGSVYYVYTYKNVWDKELKRSKRGESKKIGTILGGQKDGNFVLMRLSFRNILNFGTIRLRGKEKIMSLRRSPKKASLLNRFAT